MDLPDSRESLQLEPSARVDIQTQRTVVEQRIQDAYATARE